MKEMVNPKKIYSSVTLETFAISGLAIDNFYGSLITFFSFHSAASFLLALALAPGLPSRYKRSKVIFIILFLSLFFFPVVGYGVSFVLYALILRMHKKTDDLISQIIPLDEIYVSDVVLEMRNLGEGALYQLLQEEKMDERILLSLKDNINPIVIELFKKALSSKNDEVRLLAFGVLSKVEKKINERINDLRTKYNEEENREKKATLARDIATLYWELIYLKIVDKEL
ncbi:MAG: hypothetical protein ABGX27_08490, partial [Desulfurobacteriaceae bacterium]